MAMESDVSAACPVCTAPGAGFYALAADRLFRAASGSYRLLRCRTCQCIFQHPLPEEAALASFYPGRYWWQQAGFGPRDTGGWLRSLEQAYREFVCGDHVRFLEACARGGSSRGRRLLDIGCGGGLFLYLARRRGFEAAGMDVSSRAVELARSLYGLSVRQGSVGDVIWQEGSFDFVTMFHVLEHLRDPAAALDYARRLLRADGSLIVQVPNVRSIQALIFGRRWYGLDVPRHLINFSPQGLGLLLGRSGFRIVRRARFSLRDNPASIASSLAMRLDPVGRLARGPRPSLLASLGAELAYFALVLASVPPAAAESAFGRGGTIWLEAKLYGSTPVRPSRPPA